ncbi:hypothetical protein NQ317_014544 [Molorchus minor]|uniref:Uncharacterized protein n=1 Tax=Molorchus minor TaxID=1323400 RepID=A0ABQ9JK87_9CUCU|nr:hypothetical protein NQ317_014544 [Molorchus minor]
MSSSRFTGFVNVPVGSTTRFYLLPPRHQEVHYRPTNTLKAFLFLVFLFLVFLVNSCAVLRFCTSRYPIGGAIPVVPRLTLWWSTDAAIAGLEATDKLHKQLFSHNNYFVSLVMGL